MGITVKMRNNIYLLPLAAALGSSACIPIQAKTWQLESARVEERVIGTRSREEDENIITGVVSTRGNLQINAWYEKKNVTYELSQDFSIEEKREYMTGKNIPSAFFADVGVATIALGIFLTVGGVNYGFSNAQTHGGIIIVAGAISAGIAIPIYLTTPSKTRRTEKVRTVELPEEKYHQNVVGSAVLDKVPAINLPLHVHSSDFTFDNGKSDWEISTDVQGQAYTQIQPLRDTFVYALKDYETSPIVRELQRRGYSKRKVTSFLQTAAVSAEYNIIVESTGKDGRAYSTPISVKGFEVKDSALERMILDL